MSVHEPPMLYSIDLGDCQTLATRTAEDIIATFVSALERAGATVVQTASHAFAGAGLTSVLILRESHAVLHTWPETGTVNIDIFSCSPRLKSLEAVNELRQSFGARHVSVQEYAVPTDIARASLFSHARNFALRGLGWSLGLFALVRLSWFETHALLPLTLLQTQFATAGFGTPALPIQVTLACSGADALALCAGAILAYPAVWSMRLAGAVGGIGLILALNTIRIGTLGRAAASPAMFAALHVYVWPAVLTLAIAAYVFGWMRLADRPILPAHRHVGGTSDPSLVLAASGTSTAFVRSSTRATWPASRVARPLAPRFVALTALFLVLFTAASPLYLDSAAVLVVAAFVARAAAAALHVLGMDAHATATILLTPRGGFQVTQECISTPLIPVYLAAAFAYTHAWRWRTVALLAAAPLFVALGVARLLVVALPVALIDSPLFLIHAFYQVLTAAVVVCLAAAWRHGVSATAGRRALIGLALGGVVAYLLYPLCAHAVTSIVLRGAPLEDSQGAIAFLPSFQFGFYVAVSAAALAVINWRHVLAGLGLLACAQVGAMAALHFAVRYAGFTPHVRDVRAWALAAPLLVVIAVVAYDRPRR